jgi:RNase adaptor protein for sRNA GlmZ degradation
LKYDIRAVPNPPKAIRDAYTGVDKRLREHMKGHEEFMGGVERAEGEIKVLMGKVLEERDITPVNANEEEEKEEEKEEGDDTPSIRVGAFCEKGQHRSVAFIEELARREWSNAWEVQVVHGDLGKDSGGASGRKQSGKRGGKVREMDMLRDEER